MDRLGLSFCTDHATFVDELALVIVVIGFRDECNKVLNFSKVLHGNHRFANQYIYEDVCSLDCLRVNLCQKVGNVLLNRYIFISTVRCPDLIKHIGKIRSTQTKLISLKSFPPPTPLALFFR